MRFLKEVAGVAIILNVLLAIMFIGIWLGVGLIKGTLPMEAALLIPILATLLAGGALLIANIAAYGNGRGEDK